MPTFSLIIPAYNSEKFISSTIESVLNQTFKDFELIIVDDGSTDATASILSSYKEKDSRITVLSTPNSGGPVVPTNVGISKAAGTYITFLDHDDTWKAHKLETLHKEFSTNKKPDFILSNVEIFFEKDGTSVSSKADIVDTTLAVEDLLSGKYFNTFSMMAVKRTLLERAGILDTKLRIFADYDLVVRMVALGAPYLFLKEPLVTYKIHGDNMSSLTASAVRRAEDLQRIAEKNEVVFSSHKKSLSDVYSAIGSLYLYAGNKKMARSFYKKAILAHPWNYVVYIKSIVTCFGGSVYRSLLKMRKKFLFYTK